MSKSYQNSKGRGGSKSYFGLPKEVIKHSNFYMLSSHGNKLLIDLGEQYYGINNGDLCATWSFMVKRGWKSRDSLNDALRELEYYGLIVKTQVGGLNRASLYAFTWNKINKAEKESDWAIGDTPGTWKQHKRKFIKPSAKRNLKKTQNRIACQSAPNSVSVRGKVRVIN